MAQGRKVKDREMVKNSRGLVDKVWHEHESICVPSTKMRKSAITLSVQLNISRTIFKEWPNQSDALTRSAHHVICENNSFARWGMGLPVINLRW